MSSNDFNVSDFTRQRLLTLIATLLELNVENAVWKLDAGLIFPQHEFRRIYVLPKVKEWIENTLPGLASTWKVEQSPTEQLVALLEEYCSGEPLAYGTTFNELRPLGEGIWKLKTGDLRLFGWFQMIDCFIVSDCDDASRVKEKALYRGYRDQAVRRRQALDLDEPKFVAGEKPHDIISNFYYP